MTLDKTWLKLDKIHFETHLKALLQSWSAPSQAFFMTVLVLLQTSRCGFGLQDPPSDPVNKPKSYYLGVSLFQLPFECLANRVYSWRSSSGSHVLASSVRGYNLWVTRNIQLPIQWSILLPAVPSSAGGSACAGFARHCAWPVLLCLACPACRIRVGGHC